MDTVRVRVVYLTICWAIKHFRSCYLNVRKVRTRSAINLGLHINRVSYKMTKLRLAFL